MSIKASNGVAPDATQAFTLTVNQPPTITSTDHATFMVGSAGSFTVATDPGTPAARTLTETGALPTGVTFTDNGDGTATLAGTPAAGQGGSYPLTIRASNGVAPVPSQAFTLSVLEPAAITSANQATFVRGSANSFTVATNGGFPTPPVLSETGTLPAGVSFTDNGDGTATIAGTPTEDGAFSLALTANNGVAPNATQAFTLTVTGAPAITSTDRTTFAEGTAGTFTVTTRAGTPGSTTLTSTGDLPAGVTFVDEHDGTATLSGTPAAGTGGSYPLTITAANSAAGSEQEFTLTVTARPEITSDPATTFAVGAAGAFTLTTRSGYPTPRTLTESGALPDGVSFTDNGDGTAALSGTPTLAGGGTYPITLTATNTVGHTDQAFTLTVNESPVITSADHATFTAGAVGSFTVTTGAGFPTPPSLTLSGAELPAGVTFTDNHDGTATISGTPAAAAGGRYDLILTARNGVNPDASQPFALTVDQAPSITTAGSTSFTVGSAGSFTVGTAGYPTPTVTESGTLPNGVTFADNGDGTATIAGTPAGAGTYELDLTAANGVSPDATQTLTLNVLREAQTITVTTEPPSPALVGGMYTPTATASSALDVEVTIDAATTNSACSLDGATVTFDNPGTCVVDFDQAGNGRYQAAPRVPRSFAVAAIATAVAVTTTTPTVYGQAARATATVTAGSASPAGTVQFAVDGTDLGAPVTVSGGTAGSGPLTGPDGTVLAPGSHPVTATFTPVDAATYAASSGTVTQIVNQAATTTTIVVHPGSITAAVVAVRPGRGAPAGSVAFTVGGTQVGSAPLDAGRATLAYTVPAGMTQQVAATYAGSVDFTMSSASTSRSDPTITAALSSASARTKYGWYRTPVTVTFRCTTHGAALTARCPAPTSRAASAAARSVSRTITAVDGGTSTVVARFNIDRIAPSVRVRGVRDGGSYVGSAPRIRCVGSDRLSGLASCAVVEHARRGTVSYRATATDKAGNTAKATGTFRVLRTAIVGARLVGDAYNVKIGHTYTLVVYAGRRPRYYDAAIYPHKPSRRDRAFHAAGRDRWTLGVTMTASLRTHRYWNLGVKVGARIHRIKIRV